MLLALLDCWLASQGRIYWHIGSSIMQTDDERTVNFITNQLAEGVFATLAYAREGIQRWLCIGRKEPQQLEFKLAI